LVGRFILWTESCVGFSTHDSWQCWVLPYIAAAQKKTNYQRKVEVSLNNRYYLDGRIVRSDIIF